MDGFIIHPELVGNRIQKVERDDHLKLRRVHTKNHVLTIWDNGKCVCLPRDPKPEPIVVTGKGKEINV